MAERPIVIAGAGILGLATARALARGPGRPRVMVLEKEAGPAHHQTGHNSGVIHSGVYYRPGSLKAALTVEGRRRLLEFCDEHGLGYEITGKLILATSDRELPALEELGRRGRANGVPDLRFLDPTEIRAIEPEARGVRALHVPSTGIVGYRGVCAAMAADLGAAGGEVRYRHALRTVSPTPDGLELGTDQGPVEARYLVNCAGLYANRLARAAGARPPARIVPFRGEYFLLRPERSGLLRGLIYPVPDPELPFLGVHLTRTIDGEVEAGPNAVLALAREGYRWSSINVPDLLETLTYPGFLRMSLRFGRTGIYEVRRSLSRRLFLESLQRMLPALALGDLRPGGAGVRAQAIGRDGRPIDDFLFADSPRATHVLNAPSPGATASLAIGERIADRVRAGLG